LVAFLLVERIKPGLRAFPIHIARGGWCLPFIKFLVHNGTFTPSDSASRSAVSMLDELVALEKVVRPLRKQFLWSSCLLGAGGGFDFSLPHRGGKTENGACG